MSTHLETERAGVATDVVELTYREAIHAALDHALEEDPTAFLMGEDVANSGGVFKTNEGLPEKYGERIWNTRRAHEAAEFARAKGKLEPMHAALLRRHWEEGKGLYQMEVLRDAAVESGLDPDELQREIEKGTYKPAVDQAVQEAYDLGIHAVPTFVFEDRLAVQGAQELPVFRMAMERLGATKGS